MAEQNQWQGKSVVIVDDAVSVRESLKSLFTQVGMRVVGLAANGVEALEQIRQHSPDLVSLDLIMPEMDGVECYRKILKEGHEVKVMVVSWIGGEMKVLDSLQDLIPAYLFLPKPVDAEKLRHHLDRVYSGPDSISKKVLADPEADDAVASLSEIPLDDLDETGS